VVKLQQEGYVNAHGYILIRHANLYGNGALYDSPQCEEYVPTQMKMKQYDQIR
jgi:hypothetical protein